MTTDVLERLAMQHRPLPEFTPLPETCFYWTMRALHDSVKSGSLPRDAASAEKRRALRRYREFAMLYGQCCEGYKEQQARIMQSDTLRSELVKASDPEEQLRLAIRAIAMMTGDGVLEGAVMGRGWKKRRNENDRSDKSGKR